MAERKRFLGLLARYAVAAARAKLPRLPGRGRPPRDSSWPLRAVFLSAYPEHHHGTIFRLTRWIPHLAERGMKARLLCSCTSEEWEGFRSGDLDAVYRYHRATLKRGLANLREAARADVVLLHRGLFPFGPWQRPTFERALVRRNPRLVYDFYDSIWILRERAFKGARSGMARWLNPPHLVDSLVRQAAAVTVANQHLLTWARQRREDVRILPMVVEPSDYPVKQHRETTPLVLGWMGGPQNITRLLSIAPALRRAAGRVPLRIRVVSSEPFQVPGVETESLAHPWSPESEKEDLSSFDVGLLPMFDNDEDRGKSPLKLLQYAAAGLPVVSSKVAVSPEEFPPGEAILFAGSEDEWVEQIVSLAGNTTRRTKLGAEARQVVEQRFSYASQADSFHALLVEIGSLGF